MRVSELDEPLSIKWRVEVGKALAERMGLQPGPDYVLKTWPQGYQMFDHNKGLAENPRHDAYLMGSIYVKKFRSVPEFIVHALWLMQDPTGDTANCQCKYCTKAPGQRAITSSMNLLPKRSISASGTPSRRAQAPVRPSKLREHQEREPNKPYAAVRRAPKPVKQASPKQFMVKERDADLRAAYGNTSMKLKRWFREGELLWCALSVPIRGRVEEDKIEFWPGIVEEVHVKGQGIPRDFTGDGQSISANGLMNGPPSPGGPPQSWRASEHPSSGLEASVEALPPISWTVRQWTVYKMKLLGVSHSYTLCDDQVLPYQAYAPSTELLNAVQDVPFEQMDLNPERMAAFNPCPAPPTDPEKLAEFVSNDSGLRFAEAAGPYSTAVQIAASLAGCWTVTDEWDFKHAVVPTIGPSISRPTAPRPVPSLQDVLSASANNNAALHAMAESGLVPGIAQTVTQKRYQGLWWGAERIWADDLVRLKIARRQIAPNGAENIFPPAGPSQKTIEYGRQVGYSHPEGAEFDASGRGVFMRLDALFLAEEQIRASGMLYELADLDWEDPSERTYKQKTGTKGKAPEPAINISSSSMFTDSMSEGRAGPSSVLSPPRPNLPPAISLASTASTNPGQSLPIDQELSPNNQLSHPPNAVRYPLPVAPHGFKFRPILPPGHESVISLTLISGRYYPCLLTHPLLEATVERALADAVPDCGPSDSEHLWALEGLSPGYYNSVDPEQHKRDRLQMMKYADKEARMGLEQHWRDRAREKATKLNGEVEQDQQMDVDPPCF
jgi:hypothetical protein